MTPGPIAVLATFAGYHLAGISGALGATALMARAAVFMAIVTSQYQGFHNNRWAHRLLSGLSPAISGLILSTTFSAARC